jgi:beta-phosphoglucomutase family hydrolase
LTASAHALRLPATIRACLFDLDGVLTNTAALHAAAWKDTFDAYLRDRAAESGEPFVPFDEVADYDEYVDGKERLDGVRSFLLSRYPEAPDAHTVADLGTRKNDLLLALIHRKGVGVFEGSVRFVDAVREARLRRAVVSASHNCREVLEAASIADLFEVVVDGNVAERDHLRGKPSPDTYLAAADLLGIEPPAAAVFEDSLAGISAGRGGAFGFVVGVDRVGQADALRAHGADVVVTDLADLLGRP